MPRVRPWPRAELVVVVVCSNWHAIKHRPSYVLGQPCTSNTVTAAVGSSPRLIYVSSFSPSGTCALGCVHCTRPGMLGGSGTPLCFNGLAQCDSAHHICARLHAACTCTPRNTHIHATATSHTQTRARRARVRTRVNAGRQAGRPASTLVVKGLCLQGATCAAGWPRGTLSYACCYCCCGCGPPQ